MQAKGYQEKLQMRNKSSHYDVIKVLATILVVLGHASRMYTGDGVVTPVNTSRFLSLLTKYIYTFHMPLFIGISGMIYGLCIDDYNKYNDTKLFIKNKAKRLLIPFLFFGICYVAPVMYLFRFTNQSFIKYCISGILLVKNARHLWYVVVLFEVFILCALFKKRIQNTHFSIMIIILMILSLLSSRMPISLQISSLFYYAPFFYLGYELNKHYDDVIKILKNPIFMIVVFVLQLVLSGYSHWIFKCITAILGSCLFIGITYYITGNIEKKKLFIKANKNGFGIYLFHPMIIYIMYYYLGQYNINPLILCFGITAFAYICSWALTELFRKLRLNVLIGEK